ncbi:MAG: phosphatidate cytidylyltransferase [Clostridia bacterium]|nr:phosphatidate cytidylyltransferase [Clostridia bacterium]
MKQRVITGIYIFLATALAILSKLLPYNIGEYIFDIFIVSIAIIAGFEMSNMMDKMYRPNNKIFTAAYPIFYYIVLLISLNHFTKDQFAMITIIEFVALVFYILIVSLFEIIKSKGKNLKSSLSTGINTLIPCVYPGFLFSLFLNINHADIFAGKYFSFVFIILVVAITMLTDTFAYFVGSKIRGPKLAPSISPNKTISGAIGGLVGGIAGAMLLYLIVYLVPALNAVIIGVHSISWWHFLLLGLFGSVFGQAGDLFESKLKRLANIKDSSNIFPGHGGMLDRIDAMTFVAVFVFLYATLIMI